MFLAPVSNSPEKPDTPKASAADDGASARELAAQVRSAFPYLRFSTATIEERGGDHRILLLDSRYAFRFPRKAMHGLEIEIAVLAALRGRCEIAIPEYRFVDPAGRFAGYPFIAGDELTPRRFAALPTTVQHRVLDQAGRFLAALHGLAPDCILSATNWPVIAPAASQIVETRARRLSSISRAFPALARSIDAFYDAHHDDVAERQVILHGDLVDDHILLARDGCGLAGIIDFGDVALGDPAYDLRGFWTYGSDAVARVIAAYQPGADDDLLGRSRRAFIRYRIDRFAELLATDGSGPAERAIPGLAALLATSDPPAVTGTRQVPRNTDYSQRR